MATRLHIRDSTRERDETFLRSLVLPDFGTRRSFNRELLSGHYWDTHGNDDQVDGLVAFLDPVPGGTYLDLATGNGDLAFAVAGHRTDWLPRRSSG
jgi:hypothetical protein